MKEFLNHGTRCKVIKLASSANWYYPYKPFILWSFGIKPSGPRHEDTVSVYNRLRHIFAASSKDRQDIIYLIETLAEYFLLAHDLLSEVGIPLAQVGYLDDLWLSTIEKAGPSNIIDLTTQAVKAMQDYMETYLHNVTLEPPLLRWQGDPHVKHFVCHFLAVITATRNGKLTDIVQIVYTMRTLAEYLGRVKLTSRFDDLVDAAVSDYKAQEAAMGDWEYDHSFLYDMQDVIKEWYPEQMWLDAMADLSPSLSGGSPYGSTRRRGAGHYYKFNNIRSNAAVLAWRSKYNVPSGLPDFDFENVYEKTDDREEYGLEPLPPSKSLTEQRIGHESFVCQLVFVPKTARKVRSISKEEPYLQYLQHGVQHAMVKIGRKTSLRYHVNYSDAALSAEMARWGSFCGAYATLDLSAASDSVALEHVKCAFPEYMRDALLATRSEYVILPDKSRIKMRKFAPMGSATCFPTETTVFAAVCEVCKRRSGIPDARYWVYGDDIVVDERLVSRVLEALKSLNFKVNNLKSYTGYSQHSFREACGGEYLDGKVVTPIRVSRQRYSCWSISPEILLSEYQDMMHTEWYPYRTLAQLHYARLDMLYPGWERPVEAEFYGRSHFRPGKSIATKLNWMIIKEHPVYYPDIKDERIKMVHHQDGTYSWAYPKSVVSYVSLDYSSETYTYAGWEEGPLGLPRRTFRSDVGTTALANWLAKSHRRPDIEEFADGLQKTLWLLNELDADDSYTEPLLSKVTTISRSLDWRKSAVNQIEVSNA